MLAQSQQLLESQEAVRILQALNKITRQRNSEQGKKKQNKPDLQPVLSDWRNRLPNRWDGVSVWDSLLTWRHHVFAFVTNWL